MLLFRSTPFPHFPHPAQCLSEEPDNNQHKLKFLLSSLDPHLVMMVWMKDKSPATLAKVKKPNGPALNLSAVLFPPPSLAFISVSYGQESLPLLDQNLARECMEL
ncbi:hypothetical protein RRG08_028958 [Elysia crispata]|uniref:Uncharacterized protein n=1 Tax=Elysia crispata TaxID=231223 RepID=A0AAE1APS6_9GAST|nr:hypothetical protein RRG08_028958 [Elysia crispata]